MWRESSATDPCHLSPKNRALCSRSGPAQGQHLQPCGPTDPFSGFHSDPHAPAYRKSGSASLVGAIAQTLIPRGDAFRRPRGGRPGPPRKPLSCTAMYKLRCQGETCPKREFFTHASRWDLVNLVNKPPQCCMKHLLQCHPTASRCVRTLLVVYAKPTRAPKHVTSTTSDCSPGGR